MENNKTAVKKVNKKILNMILPMTLDNLLQMAAGIISMGMIGRIDVLAVSALGISSRITQIIWALFKGITTGATVFVAQYLGASRHKKMINVIIQTLISGTVLVFILQAIVYFNAAGILQIFAPGDKLMKLAVSYLKLVSFGLPFWAIMIIIGGVLQGMGNAKTPMYITLIMNLINIVVGYVLIFGKLGIAPMGIQGAAIATDISQAAAAFIGLYVLFNKKGVFRTYSHKYGMNIDIKQISSIYRVGLPSSMESIFWQIASIVLMRAILTYGETIFAAHQLGIQAESISYTPAMGFGVAATAFVGQCLGAQDKDSARIYLRQLMKGAMAITAAAVIILIAFPSFLMSLLTNNKEVISYGCIYLTLMGLVEIPQNAAGVLSGAMRGAGYTKIPMIVAGTGLWGVRVPLTLLFAYYFRLPIIYIWGAMCFDLVFRFILCLILFKRKNIYEKNLLQ